MKITWNKEKKTAGQAGKKNRKYSLTCAAFFKGYEYTIQSGDLSDPAIGVLNHLGLL